MATGSANTTIGFEGTNVAVSGASGTLYTVPANTYFKGIVHIHSISDINGFEAISIGGVYVCAINPSSNRAVSASVPVIVGPGQAITISTSGFNTVTGSVQGVLLENTV